MASGQPKLQPQLQLPPHLLIEQSRVFGNSTPLVLHSLFKHITPTFAKEPELTPSPATGLQSALSLDQQPKLTPQNGFFSDPNADVGKAAEGLGDLLSGLAAGDLSSKVSIEAGGNPSFGKERQHVTLSLLRLSSTPIRGLQRKTNRKKNYNLKDVAIPNHEYTPSY
jgi:hypothetical protein